MKLPLVIFLAAMTYTASTKASSDEGMNPPQPAHSVQNHDADRDTPAHAETGAHEPAHATKTLSLTASQDHSEPEHHDAEHHAHKEAFLFRVREAYTRKKGELRLGFDFGYITGKERKTVLDHDGHEHHERIRYGDYDYILKADYGLTDSLQITAIVPYISVREDIAGGHFLEEDNLGDIQLELWYVLAEETADSPAISAALQFNLPTGDFEKGIGDDEFGIGGALAITRDYGDWVLYVDMGYGSTPDAKIDMGEGHISSEHDLHAYSYGVGVVRKLADSLRFSVELAGITAEEIELDESEWVSKLAVIPGLRKGVSLGDKGELEYGIGFPIGLTNETADWGVMIKLDWSIPVH